MKMLLDQLKDLQRAALEDEELITLQAKLAYKFNNELIKAGFVQSQANTMAAANGAFFMGLAQLAVAQAVTGAR